MSLDPAAIHQLAPSGTLRVGLVQAPAAGVFFVARQGDGPPVGVTASLADALAGHAGLAVECVLFPNSGECTEATAAGSVDVAFMPVDAYRQGRVAFGPAYYLLESTYLVSAASGISDLAGVDRPGVRVVGIAGTTTIRAATRTLSHTTPVAVQGVDAAIGMLRDGAADALALSRDSLAQIAPGIPGSRITPGGFQRTTVSVAVPPGRSEALAVVSAWLEAAKRDGAVRRAMDALGLPGEAVAP